MRRGRRALIGTGLLLSAASWACSATQPAAPTRPVSLLVEYAQPEIPMPATPTADLSMCFHHSAPANLTVATSWGAEGRMAEAGSDPRAYAILFQQVPTGLPQWIAITDIEFCKEGAPLVTRGVRANGVELRTLVETETGGRGLGFSLSPAGTVTP